MSTVKVLQLGDVSGSSGMGALFLSLSSIVKEEKVDFVIANGENASDGFGISIDDYNNFLKMGIDVITSGNHIWQKEQVRPLLDSEGPLLRPMNYPQGVPGHGSVIIEKDGLRYGVINVQGRQGLVIADCPFTAARREAERLRSLGCIVLVDFHAESTSEKEAMGFHLDGIASAVVGTHTHVQTMDEKILPGGTAYITDLGMTGVQGEVIGSKSEVAIRRQLTQVPYKSEVAEGMATIKGVCITIDTQTGRALEIKRI